MSKFKIGNVLKVVNTSGHEKSRMGDLVTVTKEAKTTDPDCLVHVKSLSSGTEYGMYERRFEFASINSYPNPPHKHAELIKAWADGAEIEFKLKSEKLEQQAKDLAKEIAKLKEV